ncbi:MAG: RAMP superfamily CRISPR-associated protein [Thermoproteota archaeon]|uniref:RAMP superfamily CRISPR-associated protein n=1 Tax=Thermofilum sp. TaxID=1961369 RepID=UPI00315E1B91
MNKPIHLEKVYERFIIDLSLKLDYSSPLHIGAGSEGINKMLLEFPVNGRNVPIISAESLKGVLRSLASSLSKQMFPDNFAVKYHLKDRHIRREGLDEQQKIMEQHLEKAKEYLKEIMPQDVIEEMYAEDKLQLLEYYLALNCPVCKLFGAQGIAGKLTFTDGIPNIPPKFLTYVATSINRKNRLVEGERLFSVTAVEPSDKLKYRIEIIADNVSKGSEEARLLSSLLQWVLKFGLQIGGLKSRGYGRLTVDDESIVKILRFKEASSDESRLNNVRALLLKDGYFQAMKIDEFMRWLG